MDIKTLSVATAAGIASVLAVYSAIQAGPAGIPLLLLAAMPVYIVALAWGTHAGIAASVMAIVVSATLLSPQVAISIGLSLTIPASIIGHQANLAQENEDGSMDWYPLPRLLFNLSLILALALVVMGYMMDYNAYAQLPELSNVVQEFLRQNPPPAPLTDQEITDLTQSVFRLLPFVFSSMWLIVHLVNLQLAAFVCRSSGKLPRPKDDIAATADVPKMAVAILLATLVAVAILDGGLQSAAAVFAGTFLTAYAMVGLASAHFQARSNPVSFIFLILGYIIIVLFFVPLYLFAIGGMLRTFSNSNTSPPSADQNRS
ncbi:MAG: DUF2232 domain-containing protein [Pseudomonadota bacterium]